MNVLTKETRDQYTQVLKNELIPSMGCTEPIAIAYCAAAAVKVLGKSAERFEIACSGNIIKNAKTVTVPQTGGLVGIEAAVLAGAIGGDADAELQVLAGVTPEKIVEIRAAQGKIPVKVTLLDTTHMLHIVVNAIAGEENASVEIIDTHTGIGKVSKNGTLIRDREEVEEVNDFEFHQSITLKNILAYAESVPLEDVSEVLDRQIQYNSEISKEGLEGNWGANAGKSLLEMMGNSPLARLAARPAAGSDARMNGCALPVVINCGSGNQGMTICLPIVEYAEQNGISHDRVLRALCVANLLAIHTKSYIGRLSAFCGAVSAATAAAAGIAWLDGASYDVIGQTVINSLGTTGGMVCDGAKSSCAAKIAAAVNGAMLAYQMAKNGFGFAPGEGVVKEDVEKTIASVGRMAAKGMRSTDIEVLNIMIDN